MVQELIPIIEQGDIKAVDARTLHKFLEVGTKFSEWVKIRIEKYGFIENEDYQAISENLENGGRRTDYILSLDMAKELAMVENNEKGRQARKYFIEVEKRYMSMHKYPQMEDKGTFATRVWKERASDILSMFGDDLSLDLKRRFILETGLKIELEQNVSIVPPSMERAFVLGEDVVKSEAIAKIKYGGDALIVRDIAEKLGINKLELINKALIELGYQTKHYLPNSKTAYYLPTILGKKFCVVREHQTSKKNKYSKIAGWYLEHIFDDLEVYFKKQITK